MAAGAVTGDEVILLMRSHGPGAGQPHSSSRLRICCPVPGPINAPPPALSHTWSGVGCHSTNWPPAMTDCYIICLSAERSMYERQETSYCGDTNFIIMETREAAIRPSRDLGSWVPGWHVTAASVVWWSDESMLGAVHKLRRHFLGWLCQPVIIFWPTPCCFKLMLTDLNQKPSFLESSIFPSVFNISCPKIGSVGCIPLNPWIFIISFIIFLVIFLSYYWLFNVGTSFLNRS